MKLNTIILLLTAVQSSKAKENYFTDITEHHNWKKVNHPTCGSTSTDRIIGGNNADLGQYPWIALIVYHHNYTGKYTYDCGGSLINNLYVLTAAHCVAFNGIGHDIEAVRLGEHNINTERDCEDGFCAPPVQEIPISKITTHENWNSPILTNKNDIGLIRLCKPAKFTEFVRPICLPFGTLLNNNYEGLYAELAGWGKTNPYSKEHPDILQTVKLPIVNLNKCRELTNHRKTLYESQLCAGGELGKDTCVGDSGGPMMIPESIGDSPPRYYVIGITSYGVDVCGQTKRPGIYTKVSEYLDWILDRISL